MYCNNCGARLEEGAVFCENCGAPVAGGAVVAPVAGGAASAAANSQTADPRPVDPQLQRHRGRYVAIAAGICSVLLAGGACGYYFGVYEPAQRAAEEQAAYDADHAECPVHLVVGGDGWDTSNGASKLPVSIQGTDLDGNAVDLVAYVDSDGNGVSLKAGEYKAEVAASPFGSDGSVWKVPCTTATFSFSPGNGEPVDLGDDKVFDLGSPIAPSKVTDEQISAARSYAEKGGCGSASDAGNLALVAMRARSAALHVENEGKAATQTSQTGSSASASGTSTVGQSYSNEYFSFNVPASWGSDWHVEHVNVRRQEDMHHPDKIWRLCHGNTCAFVFTLSTIDNGGYSSTIKELKLSNGFTFSLVNGQDGVDRGDSSTDGCSTILSTLAFK